MKEQQPKQSAPQGKRTKSTRRQRLVQILMLVVVVLIIAGVWVIRLPKNYVNMFLDHYDGTNSVV